MTAIRRLLLLSGLTMAVVISASVPASATFADSSAVSHTVDTLTVQAPSGLIVDDQCITTTTTTKRVVRTDPVTLAQTTVSTTTTSATNTSASNVQSSTTTSAPGPGLNETTYTTVAKNTNVHVTLRWTGSTSRGVTGYVVSAHLGYNDSVAALLGTTSTSITAVDDADSLNLTPSLLVTTHTSYGWTADSARTRVLSC
jgi:hypothetical protein